MGNVRSKEWVSAHPYTLNYCYQMMSGVESQ